MPGREQRSANRDIVRFDVSNLDSWHRFTSPYEFG